MGGMGNPDKVDVVGCCRRRKASRLSDGDRLREPVPGLDTRADDHVGAPDDVVGCSDELLHTERLGDAKDRLGTIA